MKIMTLLLVALTASMAAALNSPDPNKTPGVLCTKNDPDFEKFDYPEKIARCTRNVNHSDKQTIADNYGGIPESRWDRYEFDHLIPLCAGGSDDLRNLWPQPIGQAHKKDQVEVEVCLAMKAGTMTQKEAVARIMNWFTENQATILDVTPTLAFDCVSDRGLILSPGTRFHVRGQISSAGNISNVKVALGDGESEHTLAEVAGPIAPVPFHPRTERLKDQRKYVLEMDFGDSVHLYLPPDVSAGITQAFVRVLFEDTYPRLERMTCH